MTNKAPVDHAVRYQTNDRVFSGGPLTPMHALAHSFYGKGAPAKFPIENIGLRVNLKETKEFMNAISNSRVPGIYAVDVRFAHDTAKDSVAAGLALGNITLRVAGNFTRLSNGGWHFSGVIRAFDDIYDANKSTHRPWIGGRATELLSKIKGQDYSISIPGEVSVSIGGND
ncbi:hypothetical protein M2318_000477 [Metapseudomonas resinovorans]|uniref:lipid II-degrading bacteriocin n=1 Tax=Metapseudomonas resinovorans TaxID=53412 RepID=UPI003D194F95